MRLQSLAPPLLAITVGFAATTQALCDDVTDWISTIQSVAAEGQGHAKATTAVQELQNADSSALIPILKAIKSSNPLAQNWLAAAFESIADRTITSKKTLPTEDLKALILDRKESPRARRLAYEWLVQVMPGIRAEIIPGMLLDPSPEFRRDAVEGLIDAADELNDQGDEAAAKSLYQQALTGAVDDDQVKAIVEPLKKLGIEVDLQKHFGFVTEWQIIGPFDNRDRKGFAIAYPPEKEQDLKQSYQGQLGDVKWQAIETEDDYGIIDIAESIENYKGSAMYLVTDFQSAQSREVEIRLGTPNAWKLWVNGELAFAREEYHRGSRLDQYRVATQLQAGKNQILLKVCQNEQTQDWAQRYQVQVRICDSAGSAVLEKSE